MDSQTIELQAIQTYNENLLFLQRHDPVLFEKIHNLNTAIEKGYYRERYSLEYKEEGYFDVQEIDTGNWLYGSDSKKHAELAAKSIDFTKQNNLFETFYNVNFTEKLAKELGEMDVEETSMSGAAELIYYANQHAPKTTTMKKLYKFIFLGTGLGLHLSTIHEQLHSNIYFIIEDDLELFRLSLFVTNYKALTKNGALLIFSVFSDAAEFENNLKRFFYEHFIYNHYIKFFNILSHSNDKLVTIQNFIVGQNYLTFNYSALTTSLLRPLRHMKQGYPILNIETSYTGTPFSQKPVLLLGAGPSFQKNLEWLKHHHDQFIIVTVSALLSKLEELGIKPDIITHVHGFSDALPHIQKVKDPRFFDESICLFGGFSAPDFIAYFKPENVFIFEGSSRYKTDFGGLTSSNIGSVAYGLMLKFHTRSVYLLGLDFALDQESGQTHSQTHEYTNRIELKEDDQMGGAKDYKKSVLKTAGNFKDEVYTTLIFNGMKKECNAISACYRTQDTVTYNLSDGAFIDDTIPLELTQKSIDELPRINKDELYTQLFETFKTRAEHSFTDNEIDNLRKRVEYCNSLIAILDRHLQTPQPNLETYHYNLLGLFHALLTEEGEIGSSDLNYIITLYLQFVSGYIFDLINTREITNPKRLIKHLDRVVIPKIKKVISYFRDQVEDYLEFEEEKRRAGSN